MAPQGVFQAQPEGSVSLLALEFLPCVDRSVDAWLV